MKYYTDTDLNIVANKTLETFPEILCLAGLKELTVRTNRPALSMLIFQKLRALWSAAVLGNGLSHAVAFLRGWRSGFQLTCFMPQKPVKC